MDGKCNQFCVCVLNFIHAGWCDKILHHKVNLLTKGVYKILNIGEEAKRELYAEQHYSFCKNKVKRSLLEILTNIRLTCGKQIVSCATMYGWYNESEKGQTSARLKGGPGAPSWVSIKLNASTSATFLADNPSLTLNELANLMQLSYTLTQRLVIRKLSYFRSCSKWVPKLLMRV